MLSANTAINSFHSIRQQAKPVQLIVINTGSQNLLDNPVNCLSSTIKPLVMRKPKRKLSTDNIHQITVKLASEFSITIRDYLEWPRVGLKNLTVQIRRHI